MVLEDELTAGGATMAKVQHAVKQPFPLSPTRRWSVFKGFEKKVSVVE